MKTERIFFAKNPWPKGHAVAKSRWSGRLDEGELWFDLHLESAEYDADDRRQDDGDEELDDAWKAKIVWNNYHHCTISSTKWDGEGFRVATRKRPLTFNALAKTPFRVDVGRKGEALQGDDPRAFDIYLLGHDSVANHTIRFSKRKGSTYTLAWDGRLALTYAGSTTLKHRFFASARVDFEGFAAPKGMKPPEARELFEPLVTDPDAWTTTRRAGSVVFVRA